MDISEQLNLSTPITEEEVEPYLELTTELAQKRRSQGRIILDRFLRNRVAVGGAVLLIFLFLLCFVGPYFWRLEPNAIDVASVTSTLTPPSLARPLGTDDVGRDTLARIMAGGQVSLLVGLT